MADTKEFREKYYELEAKYGNELSREEIIRRFFTNNEDSIKVNIKYLKKLEYTRAKVKNLRDKNVEYYRVQNREHKKLQRLREKEKLNKVIKENAIPVVIEPIIIPVLVPCPPPKPNNLNFLVPPPIPKTINIDLEERFKNIMKDVVQTEYDIKNYLPDLNF